VGQKVSQKVRIIEYLHHKKAASDRLKGRWAKARVTRLCHKSILASHLYALPLFLEPLTLRLAERCRIFNRLAVLLLVVRRIFSTKLLSDKATSLLTPTSIPTTDLASVKWLHLG